MQWWSYLDFKSICGPIIMSMNITCSGYSGIHGGLASLHNSYTQQSNIKYLGGNYNAEKILFNELHIAVGYPD